MKQRFLGLFALLLLTGLPSLKAQNSLQLHLTADSTVSVTLGTIDSMIFDATKSAIQLFRSSQTTLEIPFNTLDSLTFLLPAPLVKPIQVLSVEQTKIRMALVVLSHGQSSLTRKGICWSLSGIPTIDSTTVVSTASSDSSIVWMTGLKGGTTYYIRSFASNTSGTSYGPLVSVKTLDYTLPDVETTSVSYLGNSQALCVGNVTNNGGFGVLIARGFCWSESPNPTIDDHRIPFGISNGTYQTTITFPETNKTYYVRAFATNELGTSYGRELAVQVLMGNVTYQLAFTPQNDTEKTYYNLIKIAMDSACYYYNRYTTFTANIYVYYNAGIPTAQASYRGSIGFGSNTTYMHVSTAMHEMAHYMGSGTTTVWQDLTVNGVYTGQEATKMLRLVDNNPSAILYGDDMHFWPYGLNYRSEVKSADDLIKHARIVNAMKKDCGW